MLHSQSCPVGSEFLLHFLSLNRRGCPERTPRRAGPPGGLGGRTTTRGHGGKIIRGWSGSTTVRLDSLNVLAQHHVPDAHVGKIVCKWWEISCVIGGGILPGAASNPALEISIERSGWRNHAAHREKGDMKVTSNLSHVDIFRRRGQ